MFEQLRNGSPMLNEAPVEPPPEPEMLPPSSPPPSHWYILKASRPSNTEVLLLATMLSLHMSKEDLEDWVSRVNEDEENIAALGDAWAPPKDEEWHAAKGSILPPLKAALRAREKHDDGDGCVETAAAVLAAWTGARSSVITPPGSIVTYLKALLGAKPLKGPPRDGGKTTSSRWISAIPAVASLCSPTTMRADS